MPLDLVLAAVLAAAADTLPLQLDVLVDPTILIATRSQEATPAAPYRTTIRVTITNVSSKDRRLTFACPCFLGFDVEGPDGVAVAADGGGEVCASVVTEVHLPPGGQETREAVWTARSWDGRYEPLPGGRYKVFGTMGKGACGADQDGHSPMRTPPVTVEVRPAAN